VTSATSNAAGFSTLALGGGTGTVLGASTQCADLPYNFHRGNESKSVTILQAFLKAKGLLMDTSTGFFGDKTVTAVKAYQKSRGLPMTGMVYGATRAAIKIESCQ
jgi:peptidoglycan hydrolase-like protein with peptidoglycan-binding domain